MKPLVPADLLLWRDNLLALFEIRSSATTALLAEISLQKSQKNEQRKGGEGRNLIIPDPNLSQQRQIVTT